YAARPAGDRHAIAGLLRRAGDPDARLSWIPAGEVRETPAGGDPPPAPPLLAADLPAGRLELRCGHLDPALIACFALAVRDLADGRPRAAAGPSGADLLAGRPLGEAPQSPGPGEDPERAQ